ncbi:hypothetical protein AMJ40_02425 [candidate division TA06 bacterium DG_26]|uniref:Fibronectin type-III domain-containing protein n=1 Tax=candidate division TA06 bacterium DG_26 TaxID=1703771 RepID=A0A0S7WL08_UNCT6|nr:MAG: hypothetical protein AMJ40_02425 [candidate division TA06 bacterium DG_26]
MRCRVALLVCIVCGLSHSSTTRFWVSSTQEDFTKGEVRNVSISAEGEVSIAPELQLIEDTGEKFVWCVTTDRKGDLYLGTGDEGRIFKLEKTGRITLFCDLEEPEILSLCFRHPHLYAGVGPSGVVYEIDSRGNAEEYFKTGEKYVWDILLMGQKDLYIATGEKAKIYRISEKGKGDLIYESSDSHFTRLVSHGERLYAATSGAGKIYEIKFDSNPRVVYQTEEEEILAFAIDTEAVLWVGANSKEGTSCSVYRVDPEGVARRVWSPPDSVIHSLLCFEERLLIGTGNEGMIYSLHPGGSTAVLTKCEDSAILRFAVSDGIWVATGNVGKIYRLERSLSDEGVIVSETFDTEGLSRWGRITWAGDLTAGCRIELFTRSGNSMKVDDTWSEWIGPYENHGRVESPDARFIQWKAILIGTSQSSPSLREVKIPYLQRNMAPEVVSVTVEDQIESRTKQITWDAWDPNGDSLLYELYFKGEGEKSWKCLAEEIVVSEYALESILLPDGVYEVKVVAKDSPQNPQNLVLAGERMSQDFRIDNSPPEVIIKSADSRGDRLEVSVIVVDEATAIRWCEYSVDAGDWNHVAPEDGIFDAQEERFLFFVDHLGDGEHLLVIRGEDGQGNQSMARRVVKMP